MSSSDTELNEPGYIYPKNHPCQVRRRRSKRPKNYFSWRDNPELVAKLKEVLENTQKTDQWWADRLTEVLGQKITKKQVEKFRCNFGVVGRVKRMRDKARDRKEYLRQMWKEIHAEENKPKEEIDIRDIWAETYNPGGYDG